MAITYEGVGTQDAVSGGTDTLSPDVPGSLANNDILIIVTADGTSDSVYTWPNGYTEGGQGNVSGGSFGWGWKRSDGTDTGTEDLVKDNSDWNQWMALIFVMRGVRTAGNPFDTKDATYGAGASGNTHEITTSEANCQMLAVLSVEDNTGGDVDDNYSLHFEVFDATGNDTGIHVWYQDVAVASTVGAEGVTFGAYERHGIWTFDLVPAGAAAAAITVPAAHYYDRIRKVSGD